MEQKNGVRKYVWMIITILLYVVCSRMTPPEGLSVEGWRAIVLMVCAIITWVTEFIPIGISSCLLLFIPGLTGVQTTNVIMQNFGITTIFFMLSSGIIARAFIDCGLGYRISLYITPMLGKKSRMVLLSFMICSAVISTVLADIPTTIILSGIGYTLLKENGCLPGKSRFGRSMMMGIPIAACLGGFATPVGSGINVLCINLLKNIAGQDVTFLQWTLIGAPLAVVLTLLAWFILSVLVKPEIDEVQGLDNVKEKRKELGSLTRDEMKFSVIFGITLLLWLTQTWTKLDLTLISLTCSAVFFLPKVDLMDWKKAVDATGWAGLLIVGASNALAMILSQQGSAEWISNQFLGGLVGSSMLVIMLVVTAFGLFIHFLVPVGNAVLAVCVPLIVILAEKAGINPMYLVLILGYTSKCIFLLPLDPIPMATYDYGYWRLGQMTKVGFVIAVLWIPIMVAFMYGEIGLHII